MILGFEKLPLKHRVRVYFKILDVENYMDIPTPPSLPHGCLVMDIQLRETVANGIMKCEVGIHYLYPTETDIQTLCEFSLPCNGVSRTTTSSIYRKEL